MVVALILDANTFVPLRVEHIIAFPFMITPLILDATSVLVIRVEYPNEPL